MLWPSDKLHVAFRQIKKSSDYSEDGLCTVILASMEADSVCAVRLISEALKSEHIAYSLKAVRGFEDAEKILRNMLPENNIHNVILVNCGGTVDLTKRFGDLLDDVYVYVIDSHRPLAHCNLLPSSPRVIVFGVETEQIDRDLPNESDPEDPSSEEEDDDDSTGENEQNRPDEEELEDDTSRDPLSPKRAHIALEDAADSPNRKRRRNEVARKYYNATYVGEPASHVAFRLLEQLGKASNLATWIAIVGVVSRFISMDLDYAWYRLLVDYYREIVLDKNSSVRRFRPSLEDRETSIPTPAKEQIDFIENEIRLVMYRHWSLFDACYNTSYFASRFGAWSADTAGELERFFVKLGLSLRDAKQKFGFMSKESKDLLRRHIQPTANHFFYDRMTFPSFSFRSGFDKECSADDMARCISAMLDECASEVLDGDGNSQQQSEGFTLACDLLTKNDPVLLNRAQNIAMKHARLLTAETIAIIQGGMVQNAGDFRWATLELHDDEDDDQEGQETARSKFFSLPSSAISLAKNIINANQGNQKWINTNAKSLVLSVVRNGRALVVGIPCPTTIDEVLENPFGKLFAKSAREISLDTSPHQFLDSFVIEMSADDVQRFLLTLTTVFPG